MQDPGRATYWEPRYGSTRVRFRSYYIQGRLPLRAARSQSSRWLPSAAFVFYVRQFPMRPCDRSLACVIYCLNAIQQFTGAVSSVSPALDDKRGLVVDAVRFTNLM